MNAPIFSNHGCRLNMYETEAMKELVTQSGPHRYGCGEYLRRDRRGGA
jgi:tRNA A37 methylthiotransferase MiaB